VDSDERTWDLIVSYFGDDKIRFRQSNIVRLDRKGPKMPALHSLISEEKERLAKYDYIWLPDDDLATTASDINMLFEQCNRFDLALAQPSLSVESFVSHAVTVHNPRYLLRFTNFVEVMAPCFQKRALDICLPTFRENLSGWGQDHLWVRLLRPFSLRIAVIDSVQVKHTRPFGGPNHTILQEKGISAEQELRQLLQRHGFQREYLESVGAIDCAGRPLSNEEFSREVDFWMTPPW
jgi:hypothetical protein